MDRTSDAVRHPGSHREVTVVPDLASDRPQRCDEPGLAKRGRRLLDADARGAGTDRDPEDGDLRMAHAVEASTSTGTGRIVQSAVAAAGHHDPTRGGPHPPTR